MEVKGIRRTEDVQNIQSALESINLAGRLISDLLGSNKIVNSKNERMVGFATNAKDRIYETIVELSNAMSSIILVDVNDKYSDCEKES